MNHTAVQLALRNRAAPALPAAREYENVDFAPTPGVPYVEEDYVPGTSRLLTATAAGGAVEDTGLYVLRWFGVSGTAIADLSDGVSALLARFRPGLAIPATDGSTVRVRADVAPSRGQLTNPVPGRALVTITIPWRVQWTNPTTLL